MNSPTTLANFLEDGFVAIASFLSTHETEVLRANVERFIEHIVPNMPREHVFWEDKNNRHSLKQLQQIFKYDEYFHDMMFASRFEQLAAELLRHDVVGVNMQYFNKPPRIGKPTPAHQDGYYFMLEPNEAVTMWLALDDVDEDNGCVRYIPGSHRGDLRPHARTQTLGFSQGITDFGPADLEKEIAMPAAPGDLLVHHALTIHRADGNESHHRERRAIGLIYYSSAAREREEKSTRQKALETELRNSGKI